MYNTETLRKYVFQSLSALASLVAEIVQLQEDAGEFSDTEILDIVVHAENDARQLHVQAVDAAE